MGRSDCTTCTLRQNSNLLLDFLSFALFSSHQVKATLQSCNLKDSTTCRAPTKMCTSTTSCRGKRPRFPSLHTCYTLLSKTLGINSTVFTAWLLKCLRTHKLREQRLIRPQKKYRQYSLPALVQPQSVLLQCCDTHNATSDQQWVCPGVAYSNQCIHP